MAASSALARLQELESAASLEDVLDFYDSLPAVPVAAMLGRWQGSEIATGHRFDGLLGPAGWHGKNFHSADEVDPLVFRRSDGRLFAGNPAWMPLKLLEKAPGLAKNPLSAALFRLSAPLLATGKPQARLRMTEYRGVTTAMMIYDSLPINDAFRFVDRDIVLGAMDIRGQPNPFFFTLRREANS
jgi:hypothetical protein